MVNLIDLHTHSNISDGACSPTEVINNAYKNNIKVIALTDHDSIAGIKEAAIAAREKNIKLIPGIEISALYNDGRILHILGLGIDINNEKFLNSYYKMKKARQEGVPNILKYISINHKLDIDIDILKNRALDAYLARYDIHRYLIDNKLSTNGQFIWNTYLDPVPYRPGELIPVSEALEIIKAAGGLSFLAHYNKKIGLAGFNKVEMEEHIQHLISLGLDGIERYYPSYDSEDHEFLDYLVNKYSLLCSGGTDYHGSNRAGIDIGVGDGSFKVPFKLAELFI